MFYQIYKNSIGDKMVVDTLTEGRRSGIVYVMYYGYYCMHMDNCTMEESGEDMEDGESDEE